MNIINNFKDFVNKDNKLIIERSIFENRKIYAYIYFETEKFLHYQKTLFEEFFVDLIDNLYSLNINEFKKYFENKLKEFNNKLNAFLIKTNDIDRLNINGIIQIIYDNIYLSTLIGESFILIARNKKLLYIFDNESEKNSFFSEIIEGELENNDIIIFGGFKYFDFFDKSDIKEILNNFDDFDSIYNTFLEAGIKITNSEKIRFIGGFNFQILNILDRKININKTDFSKFIDFIKINKYIFFIVIGVFLIVYIFYLLILSMISKDKKEIVIHTDKGKYKYSCEISDILKEIELFRKMPIDAVNKGEKYDELINWIKLCKDEGYSILDMQRAEKTLKESFYESFNIYVIQHDDDKVFYNLNQIGDIGEYKGILYNKYIIVWGNKGFIFDIYKKNFKATLFKPNFEEVKYCTLNLLRNGLYCYTDKGYYNVQKNLIQDLAGDFVTGKIYTYGGNRLFIYGDKVVRYDNLPGTQIKFKGPIYYFITGFNFYFSDFIVDSANGTFLAWNKLDKKLYQLRRDNNNNLSYRIVETKAGIDKIKPLSENVKIFTFGRSDKISNRIYIYDVENNILRIYKTLPWKSTDRYSKNYELKYEMALSLDDLHPQDLILDYSNTLNLYILSKKGIIYYIDLGTYIEILDNQR